MYNNTNPAEIYAGTTWELITSDKYIRTGSTPLNTGGSNSVSISKVNLPNIKLKVDSFSASISPHRHNLRGWGGGSLRQLFGESPCIGGISDSGRFSTGTQVNNTIQEAGGGSTGQVTPYTEALGSGTALNIQPAYITLKFWKRLT